MNAGVKVLDKNGLKICREFLVFRFNNKVGRNESDHNVKLRPSYKMERFNYLGSIVQENGGIVKNVTSDLDMAK